jgi:hypothetical protein
MRLLRQWLMRICGSLWENAEDVIADLQQAMEKAGVL